MHKILLLLLLVPQYLLAQECILHEVRTMGHPQTRARSEYSDKTLPVVWHIVHTGGEDNISDEQVLSQLDVLNEEFAVSGFSFCMAARDDNGNPSNGITRTNGALIWPEYATVGVSDGSGGVGVEQEAFKEEVGCWNPDVFCNIYIVSEIADNDGGNGVQGYAYLGPTGDCRDGIVTLYNATGTEGVQKPGRELGFTVVHEMGHYLSLYHTFSNSADCVESNCTTQGDLVCDTPPTLVNQFSCTDTFCPDALTENFMDYSPETCKDSFTPGQAERMHASVETYRPTLYDNSSCDPVVEYDVRPGAAYYQEAWCTPYQDIWVDVVNQGTQEVSWVEVSLYSNGEEYTQTLTDMAVGVQEVLFEGVYVSEAQMFEVQTFSPLDEYPDNNYAAYPIETLQGSLMTVEVRTDTWANETAWNIYDAAGEVVTGDSGYPFGVETYTYEACIFDECYDVVITDTNGDGFCSFDFGNDGVCDNGGGYLLATVGPDTLFYTGESAIFSTYEGTFCNTLPQCELDYDGNGAVGNGDILIMLSYMGCTLCPIDPNQDGTVNVHDLLYMLWNVGDCEVQQDFSVGTYKTFLESPQQFFPVGKPRIYDMMGRKVDKPFDELAPGVYILKWKGYTKKVFVQ